MNPVGRRPNPTAPSARQVCLALLTSRISAVARCSAQSACRLILIACSFTPARDSETGFEHQIKARAVINATGVFSDGVRKMDEPDATSVIAASQGSHLVLPKAFLPGNSAVMVPNTPDGRMLFAVPWHDHVVVGTTDLGVDNISLEPVPMDEEIGFILTNAAKYLSKIPSRSDILSVYAGLRPLVKVGDAKSTAALSRDHTILISNAGLLTIAGGKWTTYRKMAQDAVEQAETMAGLEERPCKTEHLQIHGWSRQAIPEPSLGVYGADAPAIQKSQGKRLPWQRNFTLNYRTSAPRWSGPCAQKWHGRSRTCLRAGPALCCWVRGPALKPPHGWRS